MFQLDIDCISCDDEGFLLTFILIFMGLIIGLYFLKKYKKRLTE
jgi:hypothetical protein